MSLILLYTDCVLIHWSWGKMTAKLQTTFSTTFSWMKIVLFWIKCHWSLFPRVQLIIFQHSFRWWLGTNQLTSHYLKLWWASLIIHICIIWPWWFNRALFWRGLLSQCTRARAKQEVKSQGRSPRDLKYCSHKPECIGTTNPDRSVLITIITWHFQFHPVNVSNLRVKGAYVFEARTVSRSPPIVTSLGAP